MQIALICLDIEIIPHDFCLHPNAVEMNAVLQNKTSN